MNAFKDNDEGGHIRLVLALVFVLIVVGGLLDLVLDRPDSLLSGHVFFELAVVGLSLASATYLARGWYRTQLDLSEAEAAAALREQERAAWQTRAEYALRSFAEAVEERFDGWSLTPTEKRVGLMLLKGFSHKRIARETHSSERTVRQHAVAIYRKAGLAGRAELAGYFLEALPHSQPAPQDKAGEASPG